MNGNEIGFGKWAREGGRNAEFFDNDRDGMDLRHG